MMPRCLISMLLVGPLLGIATGDEPRSPDTDPRAEIVGRIVRATLSEKATYASLSALTRIAPHRLSGSPGAAAAVEWARQEMTDAGFSNVRLEPCTVPRWDRGDIAELRFAEPMGLAEPLPILALGGSEPTPTEGITAEVLVVADFDELTRRRDEAVGKIVLFDHPMVATDPSTFAAYSDAVVYRTRGAHEAAKAGAVAAIVRSMTTRLDDVPHTGAMRYLEGPTKIPTAAVSTLGAERIARQVRAGRRVVLFFRQSCRNLGDAPSFNVVGDIPGRERPDEIVLVGGHLDGWDVGQGAHDDGAGSCQAISSMRTLARLGLRPRRTLRCVLFMNEENGLAGARAYLDAHREELDRHIFGIESDRGGFTPRGFSTDASPEAFAVLSDIVSLLGETGADRLDRGR
ncbi:MAG: M20/M25/M40 family metallo-hydrolase, partial [Planctomycetes bacterium]|nr:M20/M25/M40 family metallo-hydrolase [Planctomycetota bacterium]